MSPLTREDERVLLARDPDRLVRAAAAQRAPAWLLTQLARDPRAEVRAVVAAVETTPLETLHELVDDRSVGVRFMLTSQTDRGLLRRLTRDADRDVATAARVQLRSLRWPNPLFDRLHLDWAMRELRTRSGRDELRG